MSVCGPFARVLQYKLGCSRDQTGLKIRDVLSVISPTVWGLFHTSMGPITQAAPLVCNLTYALARQNGLIPS